MMDLKIFVVLLVVLVASISGRPSTDEEKRLIQVSETEPAKWLSQDEVNSLISNNINFMDITGRNYPAVSHAPSKPTAYPVSLRFQSTVRDSISKISIPYMTDFVEHFSNFYNNRYYTSASGVESSNWLLSLVQDGIAQSLYRGNASVRAFTHTWAQNSVIARLEGSEDGVVIIGAHQDSVQSGNPVNGRAPGADDNASGSVALLEAFFVLLESGFVPKKSIEFQWYAAEEVGLRGSQDIAQSYSSQGVDVLAMVNYDVVGYNVGIDQVSFITDYTDASLNAFLRMVVDEYLVYTWTDDRCGYACSDHASWNRLGFPAAMPNEAVSFPYMHTVRDTIDQVNFVQVQEFVKLALGYVIELAEPAL